VSQTAIFVRRRARHLPATVRGAGIHGASIRWPSVAAELRARTSADDADDNGGGGGGGGGQEEGVSADAGVRDRSDIATETKGGPSWEPGARS
jgi:hypothetical protein